MLMPASTFSTASSAASGVPQYQFPLMYTMAEYEDGTNWTPSTTTTTSSSTPEHEHYLRSYYLGSALDVDGSSSDNGSAGLGLAAANAAAAAAATANVPQQRDTTWTKLFVGGLPYHTTDKSLRDHFKIYGEIEEAVVITDRQTGKSRGYGFVIMSDRASAERACKEPNPIIDGRKANVNLAILGAKPRGNVPSAAAFPFTAIRTGYPTSILASQYGLPASYVYQPTAYGGAPLLSLPATTASPALAAAIANAQGNPGMSQFYDYQPQQMTASGVSQGQANQAAAAAAFAASPSAAAHFAAQAAFASDPYASSAYFAATAGGAAPHAAAAAAAHQQHAAHAAYAAYLPQMGGMPGGGGPGIATSQGIQINPYAAAITQDARIQ